MISRLNFTNLIALVLVVLVTFIVTVGGCSQTASVNIASVLPADENDLITLLVTAYRETHPKAIIDIQAVQTGDQALALLTSGEADLAVVDLDDDRLEQDSVAKTQTIMHGDLAFFGPTNDPSGVSGTDDPLEALARILTSSVRFISRGDSSTTHQIEKDLWQQLRVDPSGDWYHSANLSSIDMLRMASQNDAYTLSEKLTYFPHKDELNLTLLGSGGVLAVEYTLVLAEKSQEKPQPNEVFDWMISSKARDTIALFNSDQESKTVTPGSLVTQEQKQEPEASGIEHDPSFLGTEGSDGGSTTDTERKDLPNP